MLVNGCGLRTSLHSIVPRFGIWLRTFADALVTLLACMPPRMDRDQCGAEKGGPKADGKRNDDVRINRHLPVFVHNHLQEISIPMGSAMLFS